MSDSEGEAVRKNVDNQILPNELHGADTKVNLWDDKAAGIDFEDAELGAAENDLAEGGSVNDLDLDQLNDNLQDCFDDNLSLEVNFGDGSSCRASDDKPTEEHEGGISPLDMMRSRSSSREKEIPAKDSFDTPSDAGDTTPTASETLHSNSSNGNQSDTSMEAPGSGSSTQKRNSSEIRNNIPDMKETKNYNNDFPEEKSKLKAMGAVPKIRKKSPGLARRLADSMQIQGQDRDSSSSERESEPAQIDTTVRSAQKDFETKLHEMTASSMVQKTKASLNETTEPGDGIPINGKSDSFEKLCDSLLGNDSIGTTVPVPTESDASPDDMERSDGLSRSMEVENEYDYIKYARIQSGDSYVGMRLAYSSSNDSLNQKRGWNGGVPPEEEYLGSSNDGSPEKISIRQPRLTDQIHMSKVNEDTLTEIPLNGSDYLGSEEKNFSLSPEATECDSAEVESVISEEGKSSTSGMPMVEDGLSSSQGSDTEDTSMHDVQDHTPSEILKRRYKAEIDQELQTNDALHQEDHKSMSITDNSSSLHSTPSHASGTSGSGSIGNHKNREVDKAIEDIKSAIERTKRAAQQRAAQDENKGSTDPVWIMRDSYVKKLGHQDDIQRVRDEYQRHQEEEYLKQKEEQGYQGDEEDPEGVKFPYRNDGKPFTSHKDYDTDDETDELLDKQYMRGEKVDIPELSRPPVNRSAKVGDEQVEKRRSRAREVTLRDPDNETVLIEGVLFRARYLGSTQLISDGQPTKGLRMMQAQEAVGRIKAPEGENQPSTEVDLFVSIEKIMVLNTDLQEIMMDHALRTISYIADIGEILVIMARRGPIMSPNQDGSMSKRKNKICCHVFETDEAQLIAQSIGQAFQVAYMEFLKANGIDDPGMLKEIDYQEVLNQQEIFGEELFLFSNKEMQKEVIVPKLKNEPLGVVIVESGWGSMVPTVVLANMSPAGAAARCGQLNIGDQIMSINGVSLVGLPLSSCQTYIKASKNQTVVKLNVVSCAPVVEVCIKRPDVKYQLGFSVQNGVICSLLRGGIAERGGVRVGHRIIEINGDSVVAVPHEKIVKMLATSVGEIHMKTMPTSIFRLLTGQDNPHYI